jgi:hypothetical protein
MVFHHIYRFACIEVEDLERQTPGIERECVSGVIRPICLMQRELYGLNVSEAKRHGRAARRRVRCSPDTCPPARSQVPE